DAPGRAPYEPCHARLGPCGRARLRPQDRRGHTCPGAKRSGSDPRLSGSGRLMGAVLEVHGLRAGYGAIQVLHGIDLQVAERGIATVLGANGAGKTTLLRALCRMIRSEGDIRLNGEPIGTRATEDIVRLGVAHVPDGRGT